MSIARSVSSILFRQRQSYPQLVGFTMFLFSLFCLLIWFLARQPDYERAKQQAAKLEVIIHRDVRFTQVSTGALSNAHIAVWAPDELPASTKKDLEQIMAKNSPDKSISVTYLTRIPESAYASHRK
jgi:hypothetical protein